MGKHGPCYHCGVTSTPLWRNGPPEKPVLCNACGSRWRTKGTLANYTPLHARAEPDDLEDQRFARMKNISIKNKDTKVLKRKQTSDTADIGGSFTEYNQSSNKILDEDISNGSSSGSAVSNSESCAQFNSADASDLSGTAQSNVWDTMVPSRKRTCVSRPKISSVEKLTKDLYTILHDQQSSSYLSGYSEEDLLLECNRPMVSVEIGHGSVLIRHPSSIAREEESEASSLSVDNKQLAANEAYSRLTSLPVLTLNKGVNVLNEGTEMMKNDSGPMLNQEQMNRKDQLEKLQILGHHNSPLRYIDLKEIINLQNFFGHLTSDEQQKLLKYLPSIDNSAPPDSLKSMFESPRFQENIISLQELLAEGVLDNTFSGVEIEDCRTLKRLVLCNLMESKWVEKYTQLKDERHKISSIPSEAAGIPAVADGLSVNAKRSRDGQYLKILEAKTVMKNPNRMVIMTGSEHKELFDNGGSFFSPRSLFGLPPDNSSLVLDSLHYADESSDQDLLLDVPSSSSFPQAELLVPSSSFGTQASSSSSAFPYVLRF